MTSERQARVLIIGAGVAGLTAAGRLHEANFKNVTLLEARDRIGGRTFTLPYGHKKEIELGAQFIHGEEGNAVYQLAKEHDLVDGDDLLLEENFRDFPELEREGERNAAIDAVEFFSEEHERIGTDSQNAEENYSGSVGDVMERKCQNYLQNHDAQNVVAAVFDYCEKMEAHVHGADSLYQVSAKLAHNYWTCEGNHLAMLKRGYASVLDVLLKKFPREWIKTNTDVVSVKWSAQNVCVKQNRKVSQSTSGERTRPSPVEVVSSDGSIYHADHVITTIPLGCLKVKGRSMFLPSLPDNKLDAIAAMGFGTVDKIFLEFEEPFLDQRYVIKVLNPPGFKGGKFSSSQYSKETPLPPERWYECISYFSRVLHQPNLLCGWIHGDGARHMETLAEEEIIDVCHRLLCRILKKETFPKPTKIIRSTWHSDPYSRGSYSFLSCDSETTHSKPADIAEPVLVGTENYPLLLFGGEATHSHFYSSVHGAYETGIREADRLIHFYGLRHSLPSSAEHHLREDAKSAGPAQTKSAEIVIVGAGVAGLAAAQKLETLGFDRVTVIEALNQIGGRVHTIPFGDGVLEFGAQWVHGEEGNPLYTFASERGLLCNTRHSLEGSGLFCNDQGEVVPSELVDEVIMVLDRIQEEMYKEKNPQPKCVAELYRQQFEEYLLQCVDDLNVREAIFDWYMRFEIIDNACHDLATLSVEGYSEWTECEGVPLINFQNGYGTLVDALASQVSRIVLETPVRRILWHSENDRQKPVIVECENGQTFPADHVIVTTSVQYMKENMTDLFQPPLPLDKQEALKFIGFGTINKIYLVYDEPFWNSTDLGFQLIWINRLNEYLSTWVRGITGFDQVWDQPNVLVGWVGGAAALEVESISESEIGQTCTELLRKFLNRQDVPIPKQVLRSTWNSNPYIRGSYSHRLVGYENSKINELTKPLYGIINKVQRPVVLFAGEATDQNFFSSVHGALRSGWREAERLASFWDANAS